MKRFASLSFGLLLGLGSLSLVVSACVERKLESSKGLTCEKDSDCFDGLPCKETICGGKPLETANPDASTDK